MTGSARNKYLGLIALNNFGNGLEINGGSGDGTEDNEFRDVIVWGSDVDRSSYGINVQSNDLRSSFSNVTVGHCGLTGFKINPYSQEPIADEQIVNSFSTGNGGYGFYYESSNVALFTGNSATDNSSGNDIEPSFAPSITHLPLPQQVPGHERGATVYYRYVDGILTNIPLWPWPNEELIKQCMCNPADLAAVGRVAANGNGWEPQWSRTDKTLTRYIWEYLGNPTPDDIYGPPIDSTPPTAPTNLTGAVSSSTTIDLSWAASTDLSTGSGQASGVAGYRIYRNSVEVGISSTNSYNDTGLSAATPYTYCVSAYDVAGNQSGQSDSFTVTTLAVNRAPELAPIGSRSVPAGEPLQIALQGSDADEDVLQYSATGE